VCDLKHKPNYFIPQGKCCLCRQGKCCLCRQGKCCLCRQDKCCLCRQDKCCLCRQDKCCLCFYARIRISDVKWILITPQITFTNMKIQNINRSFQKQPHKSQRRCGYFSSCSISYSLHRSTTKLLFE
uniref:Uncharacterized protein n=1 Tax=Oncorhynchus tshawytscha TaxID=74940 RepID=A0AAZ3RR42_ONCTS